MLFLLRRSQVASKRGTHAEDVLLALLTLHGVVPSTPEQGAKVAAMCASHGHQAALQCMLAAGCVDVDARTAWLDTQAGSVEEQLPLLHIASLAGMANCSVGNESVQAMSRGIVSDGPPLISGFRHSFRA